MTENTCFRKMTVQNNVLLQKQIDKLKALKLTNIRIIEHVSSLCFMSTLGKGAQGTVKKGLWKNLDVAIKSMASYSPDAEKSVLREIIFLSKVNHPNLIRLMAVCPQVSEYHLLTELCDGHSLYHIFKGPSIRSQYNLPNYVKNKICEQLCSGITYLHGNEEGPIITQRY